MQRIHGHRYASRVAAGPTVVQATLPVGPANDAYEQEADQAASNAMIHLQRQQTLQREPVEDEEMLQGKFLQREPEEEAWVPSVFIVWGADNTNRSIFYPHSSTRCRSAPV